ncbi:hypothetical protein [Reyranella sp. CPCC 100927]|uniref:hypothetical protein n=1 Tax=Reyranella sp. CPCC 100927 TaxID=2599616 RepID=UPI0011B80228|nr:hypothetical protein [Reyranella sp. CPCC 100927]TWT01247.1 hypothetical protein FQU96_32720 [Reyranella sp. CPCC 100927]
MKTFHVESDHEALHRGVWYRPGVLVILEDGEGLAVYAAPGGKRGACLGTYTHAQLDASKPPQGLRSTAVPQAA